MIKMCIIAIITRVVTKIPGFNLWTKNASLLVWVVSSMSVPPLYFDITHSIYWKNMTAKPFSWIFTSPIQNLIILPSRFLKHFVMLVLSRKISEGRSQIVEKKILPIHHEQRWINEMNSIFSTLFTCSQIFKSDFLHFLLFLFKPCHYEISNEPVESSNSWDATNVIINK